MELDPSNVRQRVITPVLEKAFHDSYPDEIPHSERLGREAYLLRRKIENTYFARLEVLQQLTETMIGIKAYLYLHPVPSENIIIYSIPDFWCIGTREDKEKKTLGENVNCIIEYMRSTKQLKMF
jgi:hypothetical protein